MKTVEQTIAEYRMFQTGDSILAGVSGGPDSVALLHILLAIAPGYSFKLGIAHVNHSLRQEDSDNDAKFVISLAKELNLPYYITKKDVQKYKNTNKISLEEAGRLIRYAFYEDVAEKNRFNKIALGHHADDNAELVLMYLLRGSGPVGISGIPPVRNGNIVRPLIKSTRSEIMDFLDAKGLKYVSDKSNKDTKYLRNKIRCHLIPTLKTSYNPKIVETLNRLSSIIRFEDKWIEDTVEPVYNDCVISEDSSKIAISVQKLGRLHTAAKRRIIRKAVADVKGDLRRIAYTHTDAVINLIQKSVRGSLDLPDNIRIELKDNTLCFSKVDCSKTKRRSQGSASPLTFEYTIIKPETIYIKEANAYLKFSETDIENIPGFLKTGKPYPTDQEPATRAFNYFDADKLSFPIKIRNFLPGDRFTPLGMTGTQKVKKFFINNKVSKNWRTKCPILLCQGKIICVAGYRIDESVKISPSTRRILKIEVRSEK
ncbi:MAG: tRNA lysidine(34) synthetase TilS [Desulfobacteraceae bacterium]|nr:tRNA lysidine(34) synthetase TilS [Desulfobacteraceae bacterium]